MAAAVLRRCADHTGLTGIAPLQNGTDAFAARFLLAEAAVSSLDVQYYIWRGDMTGYLLLDALRRAADRGVRVRLLLDDNGISGLDAALAALDAHPNAEVRLYNPFNLRRFKKLSFAFDFFRLNRRMHNKSFTVDGHVSILGGRNIGDEYFETGLNPFQVDLDVLAIGAVVPGFRPISTAIGRQDRFTPPDPSLADRWGRTRSPRAWRSLAMTNTCANTAVCCTHPTSWPTWRGDLRLEWTTAVLVSDDPIKGMGAVPREDLLFTRLMQAVGDIKSRFDGTTPYLVPGAAGVKAFATLQDRGVSVRMLTNSLKATDNVPVHAGYSKRRNAMLRRGVGLFELRGLAQNRMHPDYPQALWIVRVEPACQDIRRGWRASLCRLVQLRSPLCHAEHRNGPVDRKQSDGHGHPHGFRSGPERSGMAGRAAGWQTGLDRHCDRRGNQGGTRHHGDKAACPGCCRLVARRMAVIGGHPTKNRQKPAENGKLAIGRERRILLRVGARDVSAACRSARTLPEKGEP